MPLSSCRSAEHATDFPSDDEPRSSKVLGPPAPFLLVASGASAGTLVPAVDGMIIGRATAADLVLDAPRISRRHAMVRVSNADEVSLVDVDSRNGLQHAGRRVSSITLSDYQPVELADIVLVLVRLGATKDQVFQNLVRSGSLDVTTGLLTEHAFDVALCDKFLGAARDGTPLALLMFGVDSTDREGAPVSTSHALLRQIGGRIRRGIRPAEQVLVGRSGANDIAVLMPLDVDIALLFAERCRNGVSTKPITIDGTPRTMTLSAGIATNHLSACDLVRAAERALNEARAGGGNRIVRAAPWTLGETP